MKNILYNITILALLGIAAITSLLVQQAFNDASLKVKEKTNKALKASIIEDYTARTENTPFQIISKKQAISKIKQIQITNEKKKINYTFRDSVDTRVVRRLSTQHLLAKSKPLKPDSLNAIFQKELNQANLFGQTGIIYRQNLVHHKYSNSDSISFHSASYQTPFHALDLTKIHQVSAWINYGLPTLIYHIPFHLFLLILLCATTIFFLLIVLFRKKHHIQQATGIETPAEPMQEDTNQEGENSIPDGWYISPKKQLYINKQPYKIQELSMRLLQLLYERKEKEYVSREEIKEEIWKDEKTNVNNRIDTHIKQLRKALEHSPYQIETIRKKGFRLTIKP